MSDHAHKRSHTSTDRSLHTFYHTSHTQLKYICTMSGICLKRNEMKHMHQRSEKQINKGNETACTLVRDLTV